MVHGFCFSKLFFTDGKELSVQFVFFMTCLHNNLSLVVYSSEIKSTINYSFTHFNDVHGYKTGVLAEYKSILAIKRFVQTK